MTMNNIPAVRNADSLGGGAKDGVQAAKSLGGFGAENSMFRSQILQLQKNIEKKTKKERGIS